MIEVCVLYATLSFSMMFMGVDVLLGSMHRVPLCLFCYTSILMWCFLVNFDKSTES